MVSDDRPKWSEEEYQRRVVADSLAGDTGAARIALRICREGLEDGTLSQVMADYLAERIRLIEEAVEGDQQLIQSKGKKAHRGARDAAIATALCINKGSGRPSDPLPVWQIPLAAFGALLLNHGLSPEEVHVAMSEARQVLEPKEKPKAPTQGKALEEGKSLDPREARRILKVYAAMRAFDDDHLRHTAGVELWEKLRKFLPSQ